jgi:hypothetical protein
MCYNRSVYLAGKERYSMIGESKAVRDGSSRSVSVTAKRTGKQFSPYMGSFTPILSPWGYKPTVSPYGDFPLLRGSFPMTAIREEIKSFKEQKKSARIFLKRKRSAQGNRGFYLFP